MQCNYIYYETFTLTLCRETHQLSCFRILLLWCHFGREQCAKRLSQFQLCNIESKRMQLKDAISTFRTQYPTIFDTLSHSYFNSPWSVQNITIHLYSKSLYWIKLIHTLRLHRLVAFKIPWFSPRTKLCKKMVKLNHILVNKFTIIFNLSTHRNC